MELRILRYFVAVAKQLSFSRAAESLFISQPSLSKQIAALETELGIPLFLRTGRNIELTSAGKTLLSGAEKLINEEESLINQIKSQSNSIYVNRKITISLEEPVTANDTVCKELVRTCREFKRDYAPLEFEFHYENKPFSGSMENLEPADIYFCLSDGNIWSQDYDCRIISGDRFVLAFSRNLLDDSGKVDYRDLLSRYPLMMLENEGRGIIDITKYLQEIGCRPQIRFSKSDTTIMLDIATEAGVAIVPEKKARHLEEIGIATIAAPEIKDNIYFYAVYAKRNQNELIQPFLDEFVTNL